MSHPSEDKADASAYFSSAEWQAAQQDPITLEEVQNALSSITGSLSETVIALREERTSVISNQPRRLL